MNLFSGPLASGGVSEPACMVEFDLAANGYVEEEFFAAGTARGYDGPGDPAPYRTRVLVRRPADPGRFSGVLLVEWLNVSGGFDTDADWAFLHEEIFRAGHAYAAVSAQAIGVVGGVARLNLSDQPGPGLVGINPARYGSAAHPGDRYSFDMFRQIGEVLRDAGRTDGAAVLGGLRPAATLAIGESQSAYYLTSFINAVHVQAPVFDGFLVHSRGADAAALTGEPIDPPRAAAGVRIRTDHAAPVLVLQAEGDLLPPLACRLARQDDDDKLRWWEMAGTSHADSYLIGAAVTLMGCDWRINEGPHKYLAQAALHALVRWVTEGTPPPSAPRIEFTSEAPATIARDEIGIAIGGVRTPDVDVPVVVLSGEGPEGTADKLGWLLGSTTPLAAGYLASRYGDEAGYLRAYTASLDQAIDAGFLLPAHRDELLARAGAVSFPEVAAPA
jgi:hypothetical protein